MVMGYEESLKHARDLLVAEITALREQLVKKEASLKKLESFLREPYTSQEQGQSLTGQIVQKVYELCDKGSHPVSAKEVVREFLKSRNDVNESTIRSTLYQVTRKQRPTEVKDDDSEAMLEVKVYKDGPHYGVTLYEEGITTQRRSESSRISARIAAGFANRNTTRANTAKVSRRAMSILFQIFLSIEIVWHNLR